MFPVCIKGEAHLWKKLCSWLLPMEVEAWWTADCSRRVERAQTNPMVGLG